MAEASPQGSEPSAMQGPSGPSLRYPDNLMPIAGRTTPEHTELADEIELFLLGYGYHTARAYRADLYDILDWASAKGLDPHQLTEDDLKPYCALLRRRKYSESTIRRRLRAWRGFRRC